jgi:oxygen-independent coproporphyrinogen-3 oxidase
MCQFRLDYDYIEHKFELNFMQYFALELEQILQLESLGLLNCYISGFEVSAKGRFLIRNIAVIFDKYYKQKPNHYSKVI